MKLIIKAILFLVLLLVVFNISYAINVASKGMGSVGVANSEVPISSAFVNPALLSNINSLSLYSSYSSFITDVSKIEVASAYPLLGGVVGLAIARDSVSGLDYTVGYDPVTGNPILAQVEYFSQIIMPTYSRKIENGFLGINSFGAGIKLFSDGVTNFSDSASGFDLDLGVTGGKREDFLWGLSLTNIAPTKKTWKTSLGQREEDIPSSIVFGVGKYFDDEKMYIEANLKKEIDKIQNPFLFNVGASYKPYKNMTLRGGIAQKSGSGVGAVSSNITFGVGIDLSAFNFDYSYYPMSEIAENSHFVSLAYSQPVPIKPVVTPKINLAVYTYSVSPESYILVSTEVVAPIIEIKKPEPKLIKKKSSTLEASITPEAKPVDTIPSMEVVINGVSYNTNEVKYTKTFTSNDQPLNIKAKFMNTSMSIKRDFKSVFVSSLDATSTKEPIAVIELNVVEYKPIVSSKDKSTSDAKSLQPTNTLVPTTESFTFAIMRRELKFASKESYYCEISNDEILVYVPRFAKNPELLLLNKATNSWETNKISLANVEKDRVVFRLKRIKK